MPALPLGGVAMIMLADRCVGAFLIRHPSRRQPTQERNAEIVIQACCP